MLTRTAFVRPVVVWVVITALLSSTNGVVMVTTQAQSATAKPQTAKPATAKPAPAAPAAATATDPGWPRRYDSSTGTIR